MTKILVSLLFITLVYLPFSLAEAGIILGFEPLWEEGGGASQLSGVRSSLLDPVTGMEFVAVTGGCYQIAPVHEVCISDFAIGKYEVTQGQWKKVMGNNPSSFNGCGDDCPVGSVSWNDAQEFIRRLQSQTGSTYRLPTEAEWEYAARSGGKNEKYAGGDNDSAVGWFYGNSGSKPHKVGTKQPNGLGIYDMSGNVCEWVGDWFSDNYYGLPKDNPEGPSAGSRRVLRGGSWNDVARYALASRRNPYDPEHRNSYFGFRLVSPIVR